MFSEKSVVFDGSNEYVTMGDALGFERTSPFSISCWFKATVGGAYLASKMGAAPTYKGYGAYLMADGRLQLILIGDQSASDWLWMATASTWLDGRWHHAVFTYDGSVTVGGMAITVDGAIQGVGSSANTLTLTLLQTASFLLGTRAALDAYYNGKLDEVAVYDKELSYSEIFWIWNLGSPRDLMGVAAPSGLMSWWRMGEGDLYPHLYDRMVDVAEYPTIPDRSPSNNDGTMTNMEAGDIQLPRPWSKFCKYCFLFDGTDDYVTMGNVLGFEHNQPFSISAWVRTTDTVGYIVSKKRDATGVYRGFGFLFDGTGILKVLLTNDGSTPGASEIRVDTTGTYNDGAWHHVAMTWDGNASPGAAGVAIYVDGAAVSTTVVYDTLGTNTILNSASLNVAARTDGGGGLLNAYVTEVSVYNKELSSSEVSWIHNGGEPRDLRLPAAPSNLSAWWRLGAAMDTPQSTWTHKVQQWAWGSGTKESATITDAGPFNSPGTLYNMDATNVTADTPGGISDYSCTFNGTDEGMFCNVASTAYGAYQFENGECFSVSGWVETTSGSGWLWGNGTNAANWTGYGVYLDAGRPTFAFAVNFGGASKYVVRTTSATVNDGAWHHVAVTQWRRGTDDYVVAIYVDGVSVALTVVANGNGNSSISGSGFSVGARNLGLYDPFAGKCDEVAVWNKPLSQADVDAIYGSGSPPDLRDVPCVDHLRGWWRMGDPYSYPGTSVGMVYSSKHGTSPGVPAFTKRSLQFDGSNEYVNVGNVSAVDFEYNQPFSVSAWILPWGINANRRLAGKGGAGYSVGWRVSFYGGSGGATYYPLLQAVILFYGAGGAGLFEVYPGGMGRPFPFGAWSHFVMTYDGSNSALGIKVYLNGEEWPVQVRYNVAFSATMRNADSFTIGGVDYWSGAQDELSVWNKALTQADVAELWNGGDPDDLAGHPSVANLVGWWQLGEGGIDGLMTNMEAGDVVLDAPAPPTTVAQDVLPSPTTIQDEGTSDGRTVKGAVEVGAGLNFRYKMRGQDNGAPPPGYVTWTAGFPDFLGAESAGSVPPIVGGLIPGSVRELSRWEV